MSKPPSREAMLAFLERARRLSYYDVLRVPKGADAALVKEAFHKFALLCHPDRFVDEEHEYARVAAEAFKRGVEAYRVLSRPALRARYDEGLAKGKLRPDDAEPEAPKQRTLETLARTDRGREHAIKADRFLSMGMLEKARVALVSAVQCEPDNEELEERLQILYEAIALEPDD